MTAMGAKLPLEDLRMDFRLPPIPADRHCVGDPNASAAHRALPGVKIAPPSLQG